MAAFYAQARAAVAPPLLLHGRRRIKKGMIAKFRANFDAYSKAAFAIPGIKAVFAFADREEPSAFWHLLWARNMAAFEQARWTLHLALLLEVQALWALQGANPSK